MKVWEAGSLVRIVYEEGIEMDIEQTTGAELKPGLSAANVLTFALGPEEKAVRVGSSQRAFEVRFRQPQHLVPPREIACHYHLEVCHSAKWQLVEDWGGGFRAEVLLGKWAPSAQVRIEFGDVAVAISDVWQATILSPTTDAASTSANFIMADAADGDGGFGFSASGYAPRNPTIYCTFDGPRVGIALGAATELSRRWKDAMFDLPPKVPRAKNTECGEFDLEWEGTCSG